MPIATRLRLGESWIAHTGAEHEVRNPYSGETLARVPLGDAATVEAALAAASQAFSAARATPPYQRAEMLHRVVGGITARRAEFVRLIVAEAGKPVTYAESEVTRALCTFQAAAEEARRPFGGLLALDGYAPGAGHFGLERRFPIGVIAAITPFNFPLNLVAHKVAPALATGNTMVVKPALKTPLTALLLAEVLVDAGVPDGQVNFITCPNDLVQTLVTDPRVAMVSFTGSVPVGWRLKELCPRARVVLELGGNAAVVVHRDAELAAAVPAIATGAFAQAGQSCISVQRVYVHAEVYEAFRAALLAHTKEHVRVGDPTLPETTIGPMITREALAATEERIAEAVAAGARVLHGGKAVGPCLEPTILENVPSTAELSREEAFAPLLLLQPYSEFEAALAAVNASRYGIHAGVYTRDLNLAFRAYETLEVGGVLINQVPTWRADNMPYGGVKDSGQGREGVRSAMEEMTEPRSLIVRL